MRLYFVEILREVVRDGSYMSSTVLLSTQCWICKKERIHFQHRQPIGEMPTIYINDKKIIIQTTERKIFVTM